jgi:Dolichyl-phosphate-mannose-protein mannosyltransferase
MPNSLAITSRNQNCFIRYQQSGRPLVVQTNSERTEAADLAWLLGLTAVTLAVFWAAYSPAPVPVIDDWTYAWSVKHYLNTGEMRSLEWSAHYPFAQILWGAIFSRLLGFSFAALRLSTLVIAWIGLIFFYLTLRELRISSLGAFIGALLLLCNPVLFILSHSFMTDVPFVSVMNGALFCYVRWITRSRTSYLAWASLLALCAFLIRQLGASLALAPLGYLLLARLAGGRPRLSWPILFWLLVPFLGIALTQIWIHLGPGETRAYHEKVHFLRFVLSTSGWIYLRELLRVLLQLALVLWPLPWAILNRLRLRALASATLIVAILCGLCLWHWGELPQPVGAVLSWNELGMGRTLIAGPTPSRPWLVWLEPMVLVIATSAAVLLLAAALDGLGRWRDWIQGPVTVLVLNGLGQLLLIGVLWLFYDRYYLPLLPAAAALLVSCLRLSKKVTMLAFLGAASWGAISVTGTIDMFRFDVAVAEARAWLLRRGVDLQHIDAGYVFNGWWLYAPAMPSGRGPEPDVPFVTSRTILPYNLANAPDPAYEVVHRVRWPVLWAATDTVYVLEHRAVTKRWHLPSLAPLPTQRSLN